MYPYYVLVTDAHLATLLLVRALLARSVELAPRLQRPRRPHPLPHPASRQLVVARRMRGLIRWLLWLKRAR